MLNDDNITLGQLLATLNYYDYYIYIYADGDIKETYYYIISCFNSNYLKYYVRLLDINFDNKTIKIYVNS